MNRNGITILDNTHLFPPGKIGKEVFRMPLYTGISSAGFTSGKLPLMLFGANFERTGFNFPANNYSLQSVAVGVDAVTATGIWSNKIYSFRSLPNPAIATTARMYATDGNYIFIQQSCITNPIFIEEVNFIPFSSLLIPPNFTTKTFTFQDAACPLALAYFMYENGKVLKNSIPTSAFRLPEYTQPINGEPTRLIIPTSLIMDGKTTMVFEYDANKVRTLTSGSAAMILEIKYRNWEPNCCKK